MTVSGQGKPEFKSDFSKCLQNHYNIDDIAKTVLPLQNGRRTFQNAYKTIQILMVVTRPWRIGVGVVWAVVIIRLNH